MKYKRIFLLVIFSLLFSFYNVEALDYISRDDTGCTLTEEYITWSKLPEKEKRLVITPIKCKEFITQGSKYKTPKVGSLVSGDYRSLTKFDLRDVNGKSYSTPQKDQDDTSLCWAFATNAAVESAYLVGGGSEIDLSEKHIAFNTTYHLPNDVINPLGVYSKESYDKGDTYIRSGLYLASGRGPILENKLPWGSTSATLAQVNTKQDYTVKNIYYYTSNNQVCSNDDINNIKYLLVTYGAVAAQMFAGNSHYPIDNYLASGEAYYYNGSFDSNHGITIIGWDDSYSKENFRAIDTAIPSKDGAWIVKNTYSSIFTGGPSGLGNGYHYISYDSTQICKFYMAVKDVLIGKNDNAYYYDTLGEYNTIHHVTNDTIIFKEKYSRIGGTSELLERINFFAIGNADKYELYYSNVDDFSNATKIGSGTTGNVGFINADLANPIAINSDNFYIYLKYKRSEMNCLSAATCTTADAAYMFAVDMFSKVAPESAEYDEESGLEYKSDVQNGVAFYSFDGTAWNDTTANGQVGFYPMMHAFTNTIDYNMQVGTPQANDDNIYYLPLVLTNVNLNDVIAKVYNSSNNDVTNKFTIEKYLQGFKITPSSQVGTGTYIVKFTYQDLTVSSAIVINPKSPVYVTKITINGGNELSVGGTLNLTAIVTPTNATNNKVKWTSSDTNIATVDENGKVTGKKAGKVTIVATALDGSNVNASINLTVIDISEQVEPTPSSSSTTPGGAGDTNSPTTTTQKVTTDVDNPKTGISDVGYLLTAGLLLSLLIYLKVRKNRMFVKFR